MVYLNLDDKIVHFQNNWEQDFLSNLCCYGFWWWSEGQQVMEIQLHS